MADLSCRTGRILRAEPLLLVHRAATRRSTLPLLLATAAALASPFPAGADELTYEKSIRPILRAHCFDCHGAGEEFKGGLDLRLRRLMVKGGESGAAIVPGDPESSYLLERLRSGEMPPGDAKVPADQIAVIARWIAANAPTARPEPEQIGPGLGITPEERAFWSFQPIHRPNVPTFSGADRVRTPIDALLLAAMREKGLSFSRDAEKRTLLARAYFDLIGLPPTSEAVDAFLADDSPDAYERLIDRLLDSPHYGERWGRHWLDAAGYADSEGSTAADTVRPYAYKFRDYVIRSFNADKPFDRFICEQLAGDEMLPPREGDLKPAEIELLVATGFLRMAPDGTGSGANNPESQNQVIADSIKIVSTSLFGLSVGCAQCHDHRYDPISQRDYYQLRAVFEPAYNPEGWRTPAARRISLYTAADRENAAAIEAEAAKLVAERDRKQAEYIRRALEKELQRFEPSLRDPLRAAYNTPADKRTPEQKELLKQYPSVNITAGSLYQYDSKGADELKQDAAKIAAVRAKKPIEEFLRSLTEIPGQVPATHRLHRGDYRQPKEEVMPAALTITAPPDNRYEIAADDPELPSTGRRLAYARWLTSGRHPLVARVLVNRVWMHHFGRAIVGTPSDFGKLGERPTHPELLDWLADEFMRRGWSLKHLHRLIMTSTVYRQSSRRRADAEAVDPANELYWRKPILRLDAEIIRDRILSASGALDRKLYGPFMSVTPDDAGQIVLEGKDSRRSVYIQVRRSQPLNLLTTFDAPVMVTNCDRRPSSTVPTQALLLMNSEFILKQSSQFAQRLTEEVSQAAGQETPAEVSAAGETQDLRLARMTARAWQLAYQRPPTDEELQLSLEFLKDQIAELTSRVTVKDNAKGGDNAKQGSTTDIELQAVTNLCQTLLSSNEFLYVD